MFAREDLQVLGDAVDVVRRRPDMYLMGGLRPESIAEALAHDALVLGARRILIERHAEWMVVSAETDWLCVPGAWGKLPPPEELFRRIVPLPEDGANAMRHEILATAYATDVVTATVSHRVTVSGTVEADAPIWSWLCRDGALRSVAFRGVSPVLPPGGG